MKLNKDNSKALIGTIIFHGLLLLALMFLALRTPLPLPAEQGIEVMLGTSQTGLGKKTGKAQKPTMKPKQLHKPVIRPKIPAPKPKPQAKPKASRQKNLTQNIEKAPALPSKKKPEKKKKKTKKTETKPKTTATKKDSSVNKHQTPPKKEPKPVVNTRALFKMPSGSQSQGRGIKAGTGNQGKPHGFKESKAYNGKGGKGQGISFSLGDRGAKFLEKPPTTFSEQGTVVVRIEVDPQGNVTSARVYAKGTTVVSEKLRDIAVRSAKNSLFSAAPSAPAVQIGTITYHFILKR